MRADQKKNIVTLIAFVVISFAVTGYFVGLQSPMNPGVAQSRVQATFAIGNEAIPIDGKTILATGYTDMAAATESRSPQWETRLAELKSNQDPLAEISISPKAKSFALMRRESNRAFNGAPPTIPHPVDQKSSAACMACHEKGIRTESLRIPRMSHQFLENCTQCHVESNPRHMPAELFGENEFVGLAAPTEGPRAFAGAPPMTPHSTWMRSDCMSCHGFAGDHGIRTTHPWRRNCQQCHAPSATMDQTLLIAEPELLPPPNVDK